MKVVSELIGYPRIGPHRELKRALEDMWGGRLALEPFVARLRQLRADHLSEQRDALGSAVDDFFVYDEVLETALMFGIMPGWLRAETPMDPFASLTALARGTVDHEAWEMTKWFDTNYHYVVPEVEHEVSSFAPLPWREPMVDPSIRWAVLGPYSLVKLSKFIGQMNRTAIAQEVGRALWSWVADRRAIDPGFRLQLDEPCLGLVLSAEDVALREAAYAGAERIGLTTPALVTVQFGNASAETLTALGGRNLAVQVGLDATGREDIRAVWASQPEHIVSVMDGRSVWPDDFSHTRDLLSALPDDGRLIRIVPSTSLGFLPYTVVGEELPAGFQFAREKATTISQWAKALADGTVLPTIEAPGSEWPPVGDLLARVDRGERQAAQADLNLPRYPTTTTGSLPQTSGVRVLRAKLRRGEIDRQEYDRAMREMIVEAIAWQEAMGLDVLVHGEFERTDMVEYFAEQMDGFYTTNNGWVLSYGSRCTRPPILAAPPSIHAPMTVHEWQVAQNASSRPVKGMLTGPVTIVNWSFRPPRIPDDRLFWAVAQPIATEVGHLIAAGARVIQIDEPAVRERWPLATERAAELRQVYSRGVRAALNHVFNQPAHAQMHTHMCYGDFGDIVPLWADAGVDVASIEFSRSKDDSYIRSFYSLFADGHLQIGPGVFDVHSPHSPGSQVMEERLEHFEEFMEVGDLWVNPDCGLKTREWGQIERQLSDMVEAARQRRERVGDSVSAASGAG